MFRDQDQSKIKKAKYNIVYFINCFLENVVYLQSVGKQINLEMSILNM